MPREFVKRNMWRFPEASKLTTNYGERSKVRQATMPTINHAAGVGDTPVATVR
jgi:hypothetical protein